MNKPEKLLGELPLGVAIIISLIAGAVALALVAGIVALSALITMLLWNWVIVDIFGAHKISYLLAFGLNLVWSWITIGEAIWRQQVLNRLKRIEDVS